MNKRFLVIDNESGQYIKKLTGNYPFFTDDYDKAKKYSSVAEAESDIKRLSRKGHDVEIA